MSKRIFTPTPVLEFAAAIGIPEHIADALYLCVHTKKGSHEPHVFALARYKRIQEKKARELKTRFVKFCKEFRYSTEPVTYTVKTTKNTVDEAYKVFQEIIGVFPTIPSPKPISGRKRVIIASDFHYPFINQKAVASLLREEADVLILGGDTLDLYAASRHQKSLEGISVTEEIRGGTVMLGELAKRFPEVYYVNGNHDKRAEKFLQANLPHFLPLLSSPMDLMTRTFENIRPLNVKTLGTAPLLPFSADYSIDTLGTLGDFVISHLESFSGKEAPEQAYKWLDSFKNHLELPPVVSALFQAHTHRMSSQVLSDGRVLVATGCMCQPMPYIFENSGKYPVPVSGYVTFYTDSEFNIELDTIQLKHIGF